MNARNFYKLVATVFIALLLTACIGGDDGIIGTGHTINGTAEKGPFVIGSSVTVNELTSTGQATNKTYLSQTTNSLGDFNFTAEQPGPVQIVVNGYHFNELTSHLSQGTLTLRAIYDVSDTATQVANVNVMTHLIHNRVLELISDGAMSIAAAITQAQAELQTAFEDAIGDASIQHFTNLRIYDIDLSETEGNAYLLTLSATLYQYATTLAETNSSSIDAELTLLLNQLSDDLSSDGIIDATTTLDGLTEARLQLDAETIEDNLETQSINVQGTKLEVPDITRFIGQVLITNPANGAELSTPITVRTTVPPELSDATINLFVDGEVVETSSEEPHIFEWNPYFWSNTNSHSLLISAYIGSQEIYSNLVTIYTMERNTDQFNPLLPENREVNKENNQMILEWETIPGAVSYDVQLASDTHFSHLVSTVSTQLPTLVLNSLTEGSYFWRVRATNDAFKTGPWSNTHQFSIIGPDSPQNINATIDVINEQDISVLIDWDSAPYAHNYEVQISNNSNFKNNIHSTTVSTNHEQVNLPLGLYHSRIRSINKDNIAGPWENIEIGTFSTRLSGNYNVGLKALSSSDGGTIILSDNKPNNLSLGKPSVYKLDNKGRVIWNYTYNQPGISWLWDITELPDNSLVISGVLENEETFLLKINSSGTLDWDINYKRQGFNRTFFKGVAYSDTHIYVLTEADDCTSNTASALCPSHSPSIEVFNADTGEFVNTLPINNIPNTIWAGLTSINATKDSLLAISFSLNNSDCSSSLNCYGAGIALINLSGNTIWHWHSLGLPLFVNSNYATETPNGNYILTGQGGFLTGGGAPVAVLDKDGLHLGSYFYPGVFTESSPNKITLSSEGMILRLVTPLNDTSGTYIPIITNDTGSTTEIHLFQHIKDAGTPNDLTISKDNGLVILLTDKSKDGLSSDVVVVKTFFLD